MKNIVVLDGHPDSDPARFVHALTTMYAESARAAGHEVHVIEIANAGIDVLRSPKEWQSGETPAQVKDVQVKISAADHIVILFPLWLGAMPGLLKGFLEQIFRPGFAIGTGQRTLSPGLLKGKSARIVVTMGMPGLLYRWFFRGHSVRSLKRNILHFVGIKPVRTTIVGTVENPAARERALDAMRKLGREGL